MIYEYRCPECDKVSEDTDVKAHRKCTCKGKSSPYLQRVYGLGGIMFRGSGFYKTDKK